MSRPLSLQRLRQACVATLVTAALFSCNDPARYPHDSGENGRHVVNGTEASEMTEGGFDHVREFTKNISCFANNEKKSPNIYPNDRFIPQRRGSPSVKIFVKDPKTLIYEYSGESIIYETKYYQFFGSCACVFDDPSLSKINECISFKRLKDGHYDLSFMRPDGQIFRENYLVVAAD